MEYTYIIKSILGVEISTTCEVFNAIKKLKLNNFIFHSDCDGYLTYRDVKKTLGVLENYDFSNTEWAKTINSFINLLKIARDNKSYIDYY